MSVFYVKQSVAVFHVPFSIHELLSTKMLSDTTERPSKFLGESNYTSFKSSSNFFFYNHKHTG